MHPYALNKINANIRKLGMMITNIIMVFFKWRYTCTYPVPCVSVLTSWISWHFCFSQSFQCLQETFERPCTPFLGSKVSWYQLFKVVVGSNASCSVKYNGPVAWWCVLEHTHTHTKKKKSTCRSCLVWHFLFRRDAHSLSLSLPLPLSLSLSLSLSLALSLSLSFIVPPFPTVGFWMWS